MTIAFERGQNDWGRFVPVDNNPYTPGTLEFTQWLAGWWDADDDDAEARDNEEWKMPCIL